MSGMLLLVYGTGAFVTLATIIVSLHLNARIGRVVPTWFPLAALGALLALLTGQILKLLSLRNYVDFAAWNELAYTSIQTGVMWSSIQEGFVPGAGYWLSTHFTPLMYVLAVPFAFVEHPLTLILVQFVILAMAPVALFALARDQFNCRACGLLAAGTLALHPTYQYIHLYEFEMLRFSITTLIVMIWADRTRRTRLYWVMALTSLLIREEVALTVTAYGVLSAIHSRDGRRKGMATAAIAVVYFFVVTGVVMPAFRDADHYSHVAGGFFESLGATPGEILVSSVTRPDLVGGLVAEPIKLANVFMLLLPFGFAPLLAPFTALASVGNIGVNLLSTSTSHTSYFLYYVSPGLALLAVSFVDGAGSLSRRISVSLKSHVPVRVVLSSLFLGALASSVFFGPGPLSLSLWAKDYKLAPFRTQSFHYTSYLQIGRFRAAQRALLAVPPRTSVSAEQSLLPLLYDRGTLRVFPDVRDAEYVALDTWNPLKTGVATVEGSWDGLRSNPAFYYDPIEKRPAMWQLVSDVEGVRVYRRVPEAQGEQVK